MQFAKGLRQATRVRFFFTIFSLIYLVISGSVLGQKVPVLETNLANGMRLLMVERHDEPSVAGGWVAHVGSSNERPGITGIHLFEHMMFKGTPTIGTKDYKKDLEIISARERIRDEMRQEEKDLARLIAAATSVICLNLKINQNGTGAGKGV
jgi:predicted Zn-dependent peptidase